MIEATRRHNPLEQITTSNISTSEFKSSSLKSVVKTGEALLSGLLRDRRVPALPEFQFPPGMFWVRRTHTK